jgi:hypothetical protein
MPKLKAFVPKLEEVDEKYRDAYVEDKEAGGFILDADDKEWKAKVDEFRANNRKLFNEKKALEEKMAQYKDVDLEKYEKAKEALEKLEQLEEKHLLEEGEVEKVVAKRVETMQADYKKQLDTKSKALEETTAARDALSNRLASMLIDTEVQKTVGKVGAVRQGAMDDILNRARSTFEADPTTGTLRARDGFFNKKGDPVTVDDFAQGLLESAPFLFEPGRGGGSGGGNKGDGDAKRTKTISKDPVVFGKNLEAIAAGEVTVSDAD